MLADVIYIYQISSCRSCSKVGCCFLSLSLTLQNLAGDSLYKGLCRKTSTCNSQKLPSFMNVLIPCHMQLNSLYYRELKLSLLSYHIMSLYFIIQKSRNIHRVSCNIRLQHLHAMYSCKILYKEQCHSHHNYHIAHYVILSFDRQGSNTAIASKMEVEKAASSSHR